MNTIQIKDESKIVFPSDYVLLYIETKGSIGKLDAVCSFKIINGAIVDKLEYRFDSLEKISASIRDNYILSKREKLIKLSKFIGDYFIVCENSKKMDILANAFESLANTQIDYDYQTVAEIVSKLQRHKIKALHAHKDNADKKIIVTPLSKAMDLYLIYEEIRKRFRFSKF